MSIRRQLAIGISLLMILIMGGNLVINIFQLRSHLEKQLESRADETVTTLALSMTQNAQMRDDAALRSMIDVIFDRGYFLQVRFDYADQSGKVERIASDDFLGETPAWFKSMLPLNAGYGEAFVTQGWQQLGLLQVHLHKGSLYEQLWTLVKAELAWFSLMTFILLYGLRLMLTLQLRPLDQIIEMAEKLANHQFLHITKEPKTRELKALVNAMNQLSDRLQASHLAHGETVKRLQQDTYFDGLTDLHNRRGWDQFLQQWMTPDNFSCGWMMLIRIENLTQLNQKMGRTQVDELILQIAMQLKADSGLHHEHVCTARIGGEFWVFSPDPLDHPYKQRIETLGHTLLQLSLVNHYEAKLAMVAMPISEVIAPASVKHQLDLLMEKVSENKQDLIIAEAEQHTITNWVQWQQKLSQALKEDRIVLYTQSCMSISGEVLQYEVHCRLNLGDDEPLLASYFWPMVERLNLAPKFDQAIITKWLDYQLQKPNVDWVLNLSESSLSDESFRNWLMEILPQEAINKLILECSEYTLSHLADGAARWLHRFVEKGGRISVDHVGTSGKNFGFLARYPIYQGKIEKRFVHNIHLQEDQAFFVSAMAQVFHAQKALCLVEGIETESEKSKLIDLGVDGLMGYVIERPKPI